MSASHPLRGDRYRLPSRRIVVVIKATRIDCECQYEDDNSAVDFSRVWLVDVAWLLGKKQDAPVYVIPTLAKALSHGL
jgi:hypothetical protein